MTFFDFCSGIGAGRLGLEMAGMTCVGHSEINSNADKTYQLFFNDNNNFGDLTNINPTRLPDFDVMLAGFPCQTFSIAGKRGGLNDDRGQIIYYLSEILKTKQPKFFILENVKGLVNHNKGETLFNINTALSQQGYAVFYQVLDSQYYGVPQMRERVYFVGIRQDICFQQYEFPSPTPLVDIASFLCPKNENVFDSKNATFQKYLNNKYNQGQYHISQLIQNDYMVIDWRQSDLRIYDKKIPTLRTGRHGILYSYKEQLYKLTGYEALLLQGFPNNLAKKAVALGASNTTLLSQAGNAMTVPVIYQVAKNLNKF